ncbi:MAG: hypothetical protein GX957_01555 [Clostridiaceae bacterium]|nr:hypothetical protein [Clostridiaceae bacterium]
MISCPICTTIVNYIVLAELSALTSLRESQLPASHFMNITVTITVQKSGLTEHRPL